MIYNSTNKCDHVVARPSCACCTAEVRAITSRVTMGLSRRGFVAGMIASVSSLGLPNLAHAQTAVPLVAPRPPTLFTNLKLFDGVRANLIEGVSVLVDGAKIMAVEASVTTVPDGATLIDCGGRTLMPGLIDSHWHTMLCTMSLPSLLTADIGMIHLAASAEAQRTLMRGFTTVRDVGGPAFALKKAIDSGMIVGPRIYPSGAIISQTSGHGDFRNIYEVPRTGTELSRSEIVGAAAIADGADEVLRRTREQLMAGATQIKLAAGGGVASVYDPLDAVQYRPEEIRAAVEAAADWGTYVAAHVYMPEGIKRCVKAGVRSIEHGQIADEESVQMMADNGVTWSLQPFTKELDANTYPDAVRQGKQKMLWDGTDFAYNLAIKHNIDPTWGTDILFNPRATGQQGIMLAAMKRWYTPAQVLKMATSRNAAVCAMSGARNPYDGKLGTIEKGAFADLLIVDGDPTSDLALVADPDKNFKIIMKNGEIYKNTL